LPGGINRSVRLSMPTNGLTRIQDNLAYLCMKYFLSCDWGTTSLRVRLINVKQEKILVEELSDEGIAATFDLWRQTPGGGEQQKTGFYLTVIDRCIRKLEQRCDNSLRGVSMIISGMASSSVGFIDVPYAEVPLPVDGSGFKTALISANSQFGHDCLVISGVKTGTDIMRGEETQLTGCIDPVTAPVKNGLFIFPGTHSKHIRVLNNQITGFKTYMTGEFFGLLSKKSILKNSIETTSLFQNNNLPAFNKGVRDAVAGNLLHSAFNTRTNYLFDKLNKEENFCYLSGLLIGTELKDLPDDAETVNLICSAHLATWYCAALDELGIKYTYSPVAADNATWMGQLKIGRQLKSIS